MMTMRMLILGGYGIFGGRLAHLLQDEPQLTLLIAGRQLQPFATVWSMQKRPLFPSW
jgi:hypothetical protein